MIKCKNLSVYNTV